MPKTIDYYELEMIALFAHHIAPNSYFLTAINKGVTILRSGSLAVMPLAEIKPGSEAKKGVQDALFAEVNIPLRLANSAYTYTFHIVGMPNHVPALYEIPILQEELATIHERYHELAEHVGPLEIKEESDDHS